MEKITDDKMNVLLCEIDKEFHKLNNYSRAKFAIKQMSLWREKLNSVQNEIPKEMYGHVM